MHRVSFAISMDISALSGTSSNVEIVPMAETLIHPAHAQQRRSSSCITRADAAPWQSDWPGATSAVARERAAGVCGQPEDGDKDNAGPTGIVCTDKDSTLGTGREVGGAPPSPSNDGETSQDMHQEGAAGRSPSKKDGTEGMFEELGEAQSAPGIQDHAYADATATIQSQPAGELQQSSYACATHYDCKSQTYLSKVLASPVNRMTEACIVHHLKALPMQPALVFTLA